MARNALGKFGRFGVAVVAVVAVLWLIPASSATNGPIRNIGAGPFGFQPVVYLLVEIGIRHKAAIRNSVGVDGIKRALSPIPFGP